MTTKISCGGFDIDNDTLIEEDGVLKVKGGSGGGVLVVHATENEARTEVVLDKTWQEIHDAVGTSAVVIVGSGLGGFIISQIASVYDITGGYFVTAAAFELDGMNITTYSAGSANAYPKYIYE